MNVRRIAVIALSNRDFDSFDQKLAEACRWVSLAAGMGSRLAVLPETINLYRGDGPGNPRAMSFQEAALDDWQAACKALIDCAQANEIAVTVPVLVREGGGEKMLNCFFLVSHEGQVLGQYVKTHPTDGEQAGGVVPGGDDQPPIDWEGIKVGGGICFDINFPSVFQRQRAAGAQLFLCSSLCPGGLQMSYYAQWLQCPFAMAYPAWSRIVNVLGRDVAAGGNRHETLRFGYGAPVYAADINFDAAIFHFDHNQERIEDILRRYGRDVLMEFDQDNTRFSLESRRDGLSIEQIIAEFDLRRLRHE